MDACPWISRGYQNLFKNNVLRNTIRQKRCMESIRQFNAEREKKTGSHSPKSYGKKETSHRWFLCLLWLSTFGLLFVIACNILFRHLSQYTLSTCWRIEFQSNFNLQVTLIIFFILQMIQPERNHFTSRNLLIRLVGKSWCFGHYN